MALYVCFHEREGAIVEDTPDGERSLLLPLDEAAEETIAALLALGRVEVATALGRLYLAGASAGERAARGVGAKEAR